MSLDWQAHVEERLKQIPLDPALDDETKWFFTNHYQANRPKLLSCQMPGTYKWTIDYLRDRIGSAEVEVQAGRLFNKQYEVQSYSLKHLVPFTQFADMMLAPGMGNNVYMTAQNRAKNSQALDPIWDDVGPLPKCLVQGAVDSAFMWLGKETMTPLHHDETNNLMIQVKGSKLVRVFPPSERRLLDPTVGVHSSLGWVDEEMCEDRGLIYKDYLLCPGDALFLPIGWWHCVKSYGVAITLVYTSFIWPNFWGKVF